MRDLTYPIGKMAELNHISAQTLRLYEKIGLLAPEHYAENGYRYYNIDQCAQIDVINIMKVCGMSLKQIQGLKDVSTEALYTLLMEQDALLKDKIEELASSRRAIQRIASNLQKLNALMPAGELFLEYVPQRRIDVTKTDIDVFQSGYSGYAHMLTLAKEKMIQHNLPLSYFCNAGTIIEQADYLEQNYVSRSIFIFVDEEYPDVDSVRVLPPCTVMAICSEDTDKEVEYGKKLYQEIQRLDYEVAGDYLCEAISHFPLCAENKRKMTYKIQVPVIRKQKP